MRVSVHPVHSWPEIQITGRRLAVAASAIFGPIVAGSPMYTAAAEQSFMKSRRESPPTPLLTPTSTSSHCLHFIEHPPLVG